MELKATIQKVSLESKLCQLEKGQVLGHGLQLRMTLV